MHSVLPTGAQPTNLAPLPRLLAYVQRLGLERPLSRPKRGLSTLALTLVWPVLAWRGTGRPERLDRLDEPLLAALLGQARRPPARPVGVCHQPPLLGAGTPRRRLSPALAG